MISQGLLGAARRQAAETVTALQAVAERGLPILFFEPSCLSAIREDVPSLLRGEAKARAREVAGRSMLLEEFLEEECQAGRAQLDLNTGPSRVVVHGHCHQKAMGRLAPTKALLGRIPGSAIVDLDAGCCGMAGSFGYTRDHFDVSRAIGERRLLPAARSLPRGVSSSRAGPRAGTRSPTSRRRVPLHPVELLRSLVREPA